MNAMFGFFGELSAKYDSSVKSMFIDTFKWLPIAAVLEKKVFVCHGGLCREDGVLLEDIEKIDRFGQPDKHPIMQDLLWSDPGEELGRKPSERGVGVKFGSDVTDKFFADNGLEFMVRSHEVRHGGFSLQHNNRVMTIFSAPNYMDELKNMGAIAIFDKDLKYKCETFTHVEHPGVRSMKYAPMNPMMMR
eukprot:TRINITY_DN3707_c0_g1_i2.p1 TRINITY_DN3707_c0_g1~~TRINITY_DN3707_c0_g1_i2.p1  ORF type:complete len:190 (+),score=67.99 TRINITY_DN3707_c0_g1_i2:593-1162(+)